ncbi:hypothetical protein ACSR0Z_36160 [Streptomyces viridosporus]
MAALAVLTPVLSTAAAAVFLLLGYGLQLAGAQQPLAIALIRAGRVAGAVVVPAAAAAGTALVITAARHRATARHPQLNTASLAQAHAAWRQALLERGLLPFLRRQLHQPPTPAPPPAQRNTSPGYGSPDFTGPSPFPGLTPLPRASTQAERVPPCHAVPAGPEAPPPVSSTVL